MRRLVLIAVLALAACKGRIELPDLLSQCGDPGQVTMRRLNNVEYDNTLRDLLGDTTQPAASFPADPSVSFDNNGDALAMSPLLVELYVNTADKVVDAALLPPPNPISEQDQAADLAAAMCPGGTEPMGADYTCFGYLPGAGTAIEIWPHQYYVDHMQNVPADGDYTLSVRVYDAAAPSINAQLQVNVDGKKAYLGDVTAPSSAPTVVSFTVTLSAGSHRVQIINPNSVRDYDRDLGVDWLKVEGPTNPPNPARDAFRQGFFVCDGSGDPDGCAKKILTPFVKKAYRRAVTDADVAPLLTLVHTALGQGDDFATGIRLALKRVLSSADFLFKVETDASPSDTTPHPLDQYELATRLSYFLWASAPDDQLLAQADQGRLSDPAVLEQQARRMLADPKAEALVDVFAAQWFKVRAFELHTASLTAFPEFDAPLKDAMANETLLLLKSFLFEDRSALDLLDANYTFLNDKLAAHYGVAGVTGSDMQKVMLQTSQRGGLLTNGSVLTVTSQPNRTSPVRRGKWVLDQILCQPPPPPPPNVPPIPSDGQVSGATLRQLTEEHRDKNSVCSGCHIQMDPIGYAMEHYDGVGHWRDQDNGQPIDATGQLPDGATFDGAQQLAGVLKADPRFATCMSRKMLTYALGRELTADDACVVDALTEGQAAKGYRLKELAVSVVKAPAFRNRRPGKAASP